MDSITTLEEHYGIPLPAGYREWSSKGYLDFRNGDETYLWVHEAEWIVPEKIPERDLWRKEIIPGLIPFAYSGAGDNWCWNTGSTKTGNSDHEVLFCWHDEELADAFAPTFFAWFYRVCLDYASGAIDDDPDGIEEGREWLRLWAERLGEIHPGAWSDHLAALAEATPLEYTNPGSRGSFSLFGFVTEMEVEEIVAREFGRRYLEDKVAWGKL
jgi:hypothetical protein